MSGSSPMKNRNFGLLLSILVLLQGNAYATAEGTGLTRVECNKAALFAAGTEGPRHYASDNDLEVL